MNRLKTVHWLSILGVAIILLLSATVIIDRATHPDSSYNVPATGSSSNSVAKNIKIGNKVGNLAPDFRLTTIDNNTVSLSDYRGKHVILNFWATWCGPCRYETPFLQSAYEESAKDGVIVIAINTQDGFENASSYARMYNLTFTIPVDITGTVARQFGVYGMPTTFMIDEEGVITSIKIGPFIGKEEIEERIQNFQ